MRRLLDEREVEEYADAGVNPILSTSVEQSPIFTPQDTGTDVFANLNAAGLKEETPSIVPTTAPTSTISAGNQPLIDASNLIQQFTQANPEFAKGFDFSNVGRLSDESTGRIEAPSADFGGYTIKALGNFADVGEGSYAPVGGLGGYEATKSEMQASGKPIISTLKYDPSGALTGKTVRVYEGSDSGTEYYLDAAGNVSSAKFDESESWKQTAIPLLQMAALAAAPYLQGAGLATKIGAGAAFSGASAALQGKEGSDLLRAAAIGGAGAGVGAGLGETAGKYAGSLINDPTISPIVKSAVEGGIKALPGAIATGDYGRALTGALVSGGMQAADIATADIDIPFTRQQAEAGINLVRAVNSGNMMSAANAAAALINNPDVTVATRAATLLKAMQSGNINAVMAAAQMLGNTIAQSSKTPIKTAEAPGGAFETSAIIDEFGDMGGTLVPGEGGDETVNVFGTRSPGDVALDYFFSPEDTTVGQRVGVEGTRIKPEELGPFVDLFDKDRVDQRVGVTGKTIKKDEDITDQKVDVTAKTLPKEEAEETKPTTTTTTKPTTPARPGFGIAGLLPLLQPAQQVAPQLAAPLADVFYGRGAVRFGEDTASMADPTDFQGRMSQAKEALELALEGKGGENVADSAYERFAALVDENPGATVRELEKIVGIGRG